jgi:transposase-like protein
MNKENSEPKKRRIHRSPEKIVELILEAERTNNAAQVCRREGILPAQFSRWKSKFKEGAVEAIKSSQRRGPKSDPKMDKLQRENEKLKEAFCDASIELQLLKKNGI